MLSISLRKSVATFLSQSNDFDPLFDLIKRVAAHYDSSIEHILAHSDGGEKLSRAAASLQNSFTSLNMVSQRIVPRMVYKSLEAFKSAVASSFDIALRDHSFISGLVEGVDSFIAHYDSFLMQQNPSNASKLMLEASYLNRQLNSTIGALNFIETAIDSNQQASEGEKALSLVLYQTASFIDFVRKLEALQKLYSELCMLLQVSEAVHPLRVGKIESGSLWVTVFGDTKVTQLLASLIESTAGYLHRRFTTEGKIGSVPRKLEALEAAIEVSSKLEALGIDTSEMNEHMKKSGVLIAKNLATLLEDQPRITLNNRLHSVDALAEPLFLAQRATLQLTDGTDRIDPTVDDQDSNPPSKA